MITVTPEDFGAIGDGVANDAGAFDSALAALAAAGGGIFLGDPGASYSLFRDVEIPASHITMDFRGAVLTAKGRLIACGDSGVHGDRSGVLVDVHIRNARLRGLGGYACPRGPRLWWVDDSSISGIDREGQSGSVLNLYMACKTVVRNCRIAGGRDTPGGGMIGVLLWHSSDCIVDDVEIDGQGLPFAYGLQIKGGSRNVVSRVRVHDSVDGSHVSADVGIRDRGDAPWGSSSSSSTYPYDPTHCPPGSDPWAYPDARRATCGTIYRDCLVERCSGHGYQAQEDSAPTWVNCEAQDVSKKGFVINRLSAGTESNATLIRPVVDGAGLYGIQVASGHVDPYERVTVSDRDIGDTGLDPVMYTHADVADVRPSAQ